MDILCTEPRIAIGFLHGRPTENDRHPSARSRLAEGRERSARAAHQGREHRRSQDLGRGHTCRLRDRPSPEGRREALVQPRVDAPHRMGSAAVGSRRRSAPPRTRFGRGIRAPAFRNGLRRPVRQGAAGVGARSALSQLVLHDVHHPGGASDPRRSPPAVLDAALDARAGMAPDAERGPGHAAVDRQAGLADAAEAPRAARPAPLHRPRALCGTWASTRSGWRTGSPSTRCCSRPASGVASSRRRGRSSPTRRPSFFSTCRCAGRAMTAGSRTTVSR